MSDTTLCLLQATLEIAVPMWMERLRLQGEEYRAARAHALADVIAEKGDIILYRSKKTGESATAFNALAEGIAALSFQPGGVTVFGLHFEAEG
jgi:hypothetical protein